MDDLNPEIIDESPEHRAAQRELAAMEDEEAATRAQITSKARQELAEHELIEAAGHRSRLGEQPDLNIIRAVAAGEMEEPEVGDFAGQVGTEAWDKALAEEKDRLKREGMDNAA